MNAGRLLLLGFLGALNVSALTGQTVVLDEGSFRLQVAGREVGTETFTIRQNGTGENAVVIAQGRVTLDTAGNGQQLNARLQVSGPALRPAAYEMTVSGPTREEIAGQVTGSRFSARILSSTGEEMREYVASAGAVVADEGVAHHYYFLAQRIGSESAQVPVIIPRRNQQVVARVSGRGNESVTVGTSSLQARHLVISMAAGGDRHVWVDAQGRVLKLEIPGRNFVATRVAAPK